MSRQSLLGLSTLAVIGFVVLLGNAIAQQASDYDVVILNGRVMDPETDLDAVRNVGIRGGKIETVSSESLQGRTRLDAIGLVVSPGFIDLHQHGQNAENDAVKVADGVTTALELETGVADVDAWYAARAKNALINFGASSGHIPARMAVMHDRGGLLPNGPAAYRAATSEELRQIEAAIEKGLKRGALAVGLGTGYTPGASNLEILKVFEIAARHGASVHVHIRGTGDDPDGTFSGFQEVLADAAVTGAALHIVHIQSTSGPNVIHELNMIRGARSRGLDITTEAYPYDHGATQIQSALFDNKEKEPDSYFSSLLWPATGENLTRESFLRYRKTGGRVIIPSTTPELVRTAILDPLTMIASDGILDGGKGHPRTAGAFARVLAQYVREERALPLMDALRKMTLMPAQRLEKRVPAMRDKGRLRPGADADITVFDPMTVRDASTYTEPALQSLGMRYVLVNGVVMVKDGRVQAGLQREGKSVRPSNSSQEVGNAAARVRRTWRGVGSRGARAAAGAARDLFSLSWRARADRESIVVLNARNSVPGRMAGSGHFEPPSFVAATAGLASIADAGEAMAAIGSLLRPPRRRCSPVTGRRGRRPWLLPWAIRDRESDLLG